MYILQFYCCTWLHHELCQELFTRFHGGTTRENMFGLYLHSLVAHAPMQFEIVPLSSVNTENQERIFSQARKTATATSNRHPQNVVSSLTLRLQAKNNLKEVTAQVRQQESRVSKASKSIPKYKGTKVDVTFVERHLKSWNQLLRRISPFLLHGKGVWWEEILGGYRFCDSETDPSNHASGPHLLHFRSATLKDVKARHSQCRTPTVCLYDENGMLNGSIRYQHDNLHITVQQDDNGDQTENTQQNADTQPSAVQTQGTSTHTQENTTVVQEENVTVINVDLDETLANTVQFKTKHAACFSKVLGNLPELVEFDNLMNRQRSCEFRSLLVN